MIRLLSMLAASALLAGGAHAGEPRPTRIIPAMTAIQAGKALALWAPDLRSVIGVDADGQRLWRLATGDQGGLRDLDLLAGNVLVYAGAEAILVAPDSGKVLGRQAEVELGSPGGPRGCRIAHEEGACALACECRFQVVRCDDLAPLGEPALLPRFEERTREGEPASHCPIFSGALLGRSGEAVITSFPAATDKPFFGVPEITIARHATTGVELWRSADLGFFDEALSGVLGDGLCYAGSRAGSVSVFDCQRATVLWKRSFTIPKGGEPQLDPTAHGLLVRDGTRVALLDPRTGQARWQADVPAENLALLATGGPPARMVDRRFARSVIGARILEPSDGHEVAALRFPEGTTRWPRPFGDGWIVLGERHIEAYDGSGRSLGGLGSSSSYADLVLGTGHHLAAWDRTAVSLAALPSPRPAAHIDEADLRVVAFEGALGAGRLAVMKEGRGPWDAKNPDTFGELRLYSIEPR